MQPVLGGVMFKIPVFLVTASVVLVAACGPSVPALPKINIAESHIQILDNDIVFWRDPVTVVFRGADRGKEPGDGEHLPSDWFEFPDNKAQLFEWKLGQVPKAFSVDGWPRIGIPKWGMYFCTAEGEVTFDRRLANKSVPASTQLPNRQNSDRGILKSGWWSSPYYFDMRDGICRHVPGPQMQDHRWNITYSDRYILDFGVRDKRLHGKKLTDVVHLIDTKKWKPIPIIGIPRSGDDVDVVVPSYEDSFVMWNRNKDKNGNVLNLWKVYPDGRSVHTSVLYNKYKISEVIPYKFGYYFIMHGQEGDKYWGGWGLYILEHGKFRQVWRGVTEFAAMSHDGCHGAFRKIWYGGFMGEVSHNSLVVINLCNLKDG